MRTISVSQVIPVLPVAIGSVVVVSGVRVLSLSLTNRVGRVIDGGRSLARERLEIPEQNRPNTVRRLHILSERANFLQHAIPFAVIGVLWTAVLAIMLFFTAALHIEAAGIIGM